MDDKKLLVSLSSASIITTLLGSVFANQIVGVPCLLYDKNRPWFDRWTRHMIGGVCGMGVVTGGLMVLLICVQLYFLIKLDLKDKNTVFWLKWTSLLILAIYFILQLLLNSWVAHQSKGYSSVGLWEYMLPTYLLQFGILYTLFRLK